MTSNGVGLGSCYDVEETGWQLHAPVDVLTPATWVPIRWEFKGMPKKDETHGMMRGNTMSFPSPVWSVCSSIMVEKPGYGWWAVFHDGRCYGPFDTSQHAVRATWKWFSRKITRSI